MSAAEAIAIAAAVTASTGALARASTHRRIHAAGVPLLLLGWAGLVTAIAPTGVRERWPLVLVAALVALGVAWLVAGVLRGHERWVLAAGAAFLTLRIPVPTGGDDSAMLLGPLYVVVGIGAVLVLRSGMDHRRDSIDRHPRAMPDEGGATRLLDVGVAALVAAATLSLTWSFDRAASAEALAFFLVPFALAYALVRSWAAGGVDLRPAGWALLASAVVAASVGLFQAATRQVWWNPKVVEANRFRPDFRTNSVFWDPNIYGRALVVALLLMAAWLLVTRLERRRIAAAVLVVATLVVALWNTYSQSSWIALAAGLVVVAVLTLPPNPRRWTAALLAVGMLVALPAAGARLAGDDADGRRDVVREGLALAAEKPLLGWGINSFEAAARARALEKGDRTPRLTASHTTPVTVFAELGLLGAFTYLTLLASAAVAVLARWRRASTPAAEARARGDATATGWPEPAIIWATGALMVLVTHSLLYAGFFEDATLWVALALVASLPALRDGDVEPAPQSRRADTTTGAAGSPATPVR